MAQILVYTAGIGGAAPYAVDYLVRSGIPVVDYPTPDITHLLLDCPSRTIPDGLLERLPEGITVVGGNLNKPELKGYRKLDLLKHEGYLAKNAAITADCALRVAAARTAQVFFHMPVLVIGWGRIGKCLCSLLKRIGCCVTVASGTKENRAILEALAYRTADPQGIQDLGHYAIVLNTAPAPVLTKATTSNCPDTIKIDLASVQGLPGEDVIWARGLPGLYAPDSSGKLIADIFMKEVCT